ncbi:MAG: pyridoxal phosphate-dependent aminotransferase [Deltaproteobacteria bacterium]|nr:pyridoxal phosphate-dependent aminotransferase [Deltaproteobacteria bacterium]
MSISRAMEESIEKSSWIRKMFEEGAKLAAIHGRENVYDFTLGNPNVEPPEAFYKALSECADTAGRPVHGYMPNGGYPDVRAAVAEFASKELGAPLTANEIIMTCGAAGALNVALKAIVNPGDEVLTPAPFFAEYTFYVQNHGAVLKTVPTNPDFSLNIDAFRAAISEKTAAVIINSPNNPTGQVYSRESLDALAQALTEGGKKHGRTIYLISDEPYRRIVYDGAEVPPVFESYPDSMVATSYSKELSIPGERIGWLAVHPKAADKDKLIAAMTLANRILGFVNAPALMQRVIAKILGAGVDVSHYARKRELLTEGLKEAGYVFEKPRGAFYLFMKSPIEDDVAFVRELQSKERILTVPGRGFGGPGHIRIAFCVDDETIKKAIPGFARVLKSVG